MENSYQETDETISIFKYECEKILRDFVLELNEFEKSSDINIITKLMRDAHSVKGSAGIVGLHNVQKLAHKTEDLLLTLKCQLSGEKFDNEFENFSKQDILEKIKEYVFEIIKIVKASFDNSEKNIEDFFNDLLKCVSLLKSNLIENSKEAENIIKFLLNKNFDAQILELLETLKNIFSKLQKTKDVESNIINTLSGAIKTIKRNICGEENLKDDILFLNQRLSVASEMIVVESVQELPKINNSRPLPNKNSQSDISDILKMLGQNSIKTLRIETSKLDGLYENVCYLGDLTEKSKHRYKSTFDITESFSEKIFEFEKIINKVKYLTEKAETETNYKTFLQDIKNEMNKSIDNLSSIQSLMAKYEEVVNEEKVSFPLFEEYFEKIEKTVKGIRILPIGVVFHMFPRMIRDIAKEENKDVQIEIIGNETGVDKKILEEIKTPLIHLLRNAIDHGIEMPQQREFLGKNPLGKILISAKNQENNLIITVKDDGSGIDFDKVKEIALKQNLFSKDELDNFNKQDLLNILYKAGFTTEDKVTEISGRGIGLDIVYTKIKELNGDIKINTDKFVGTEIILVIPSGYHCEKLNTFNEKQIKKEKIIVVDDSKTTKMYISKILTQVGYDVKSFDNAKDCLNELSSNKYDLLISDIEMPEMNGDEMIKILRQKENNIPIIVLSMLPVDKVNLLFENIKVNKIINKSDFDEKKLIECVKKILK